VRKKEARGSGHGKIGAARGGDQKGVIIIIVIVVVVGKRFYSEYNSFRRDN
jgi:hypothetical protein